MLRLEFHLYHGMDHFFVYTFGTVDDVYEEILKPYLLAGAATRIHFKTRPDFHRLRHYWSMTDCLYRSKTPGFMLLYIFCIIGEVPFLWNQWGIARFKLDCQPV